MKPELARMVAHELAAELKASIRGHHPPGSPLNLAGVLAVGAMITRALEAYAEKPGADPFPLQLEGLINTLRLGKLSESELESVLYPHFLNDTVKADDFRLAVQLARSLLEIPDFLKQVLNSAMKDLTDSATPEKVGGGAATIALRSAQLRQAAEVFIHANAISPKKSVMDLVDLLCEEHPQAASELAQHIKAIEGAVASTEYLNLKTSESRTTFLADAMAGSEIVIVSDNKPGSWSATYAHQVAEEGRRILKKSQE